MYSSMKLVDNKEQHKLALPIDPKQGYAFVRYGLRDHHIDLHHIEVSPGLRGQGIASVLAEKVFAFIAEKQLDYTIYCSFLKTWKYRRDSKENDN